MIDLKPVDVADAQLIYRAWGSDRENFTYLTAQAFEDVGDAERYLARLFSIPESQAFHIVDSVHGVVGLVKATVAEHRAQVGYVVDRRFWGQGMATTAVRHLLERLDALPQLSRIWATCALDNPASARVLEKCGFQREAILRNWVVYPAQGGRAFDNYSYVRIPSRAGSAAEHHAGDGAI